MLHTFFEFLFSTWLWHSDHFFRQRDHLSFCSWIHESALTFGKGMRFLYVSLICCCPSRSRDCFHSLALEIYLSVDFRTDCAHIFSHKLKRSFTLQCGPVLCCVRCWSRYYRFYLHFGKQHINSFICSVKPFACVRIYFFMGCCSNCVWSKQILCYTLERFESLSHTYSKYCSFCALFILFRSIHSHGAHTHSHCFVYRRRRQ